MDLSHVRRYPRRVRLHLLAPMLLLHVAAAQPDPGYELVPSPPTAARAGKPATLSLTVLPHAGHRLLASAPLEVRVTADGATLPRPSLHREDAIDPRAEAPRFEVPFVAAAPGRARIDAECTFYLCRGERCRPVIDRVSWTVEIAR